MLLRSPTFDGLVVELKPEKILYPLFKNNKIFDGSDIIKKLPSNSTDYVLDGKLGDTSPGHHHLQSPSVTRRREGVPSETLGKTERSYLR